MSEDSVSQFEQFFALFQFHRIVLLILGLGTLVLIVRGITRLSEELFHRLPARRLLFSQIATILNFFIYIVGGVSMFYVILEPPREMMLAVAGSAAVAFGLSLKDLVASVLAGFILLFDRPFQVGDRVTIDNVYGEIKSIGLRAVRLVTLDDNEVTIPNNRFMTDVVASGNSGALDMMVPCDFHISLHANLELARETLHEIIVTSRYVYLNKPVAIVINEVAFAERIAIRLTAKAYVLDVRFEKAFQSDLVYRTTQAFKQLKIERPLITSTGRSEFANG